MGKTYSISISAKDGSFTEVISASTMLEAGKRFSVYLAGLNAIGFKEDLYIHLSTSGGNGND